MITSATVNGTFYNIDDVGGAVYCSTEKIIGESRKMMVFELGNEIWRTTIVLPIPNDDLIVLEKIIRAVIM